MHWLPIYWFPTHWFPSSCLGTRRAKLQLPALNSQAGAWELAHIDANNAGIYRHENVLIAGAELRPPDYLQVPGQMTALVQAYPDFIGHPAERAARLHVDFVKIHPFVDGNGRTARLLMNFDLMKAGFLPVIFKAADHLAYYEALDKAHTQNDYNDFLHLSINAEILALKNLMSLDHQVFYLLL